MSENSTYKKERDIWNAQALKSFVKAKTDWFNGDDYDSRLHLSFVEHKGNCQMLCTTCNLKKSAK